MSKSNLFLYLMMIAIITFPSCNASNQTKGAVIGAGAGAAAGALLGKDNKAVAIILGAAVGGVAGGLIGNYMDKQAAKIQDDLEGATVERVGEGILITLIPVSSLILHPTRSSQPPEAISTNYRSRWKNIMRPK